MNELERALKICELFRERRTRTVPESIWIGTKSTGSITSVGTKAVDLAQAREVYKQLIEELSRNGWSEEAHRLVLRLGETLSSNLSSTPSSPDEGGQAEERSGWQNPDSELRPAFRPGEARRGLRDAATTQAKGRVLRELELMRLQGAIHEAQISQKKLRSDLERSGRDEARQVLDRVTKSIEERHLKRGRAP